MNERIRLLAEQAGLKYHNWITNESNVKDGDFRYPRLEDLENFAELIVRECFKAAMIESKGHMNPIDLMKRMKERVGVSE